MQYWNNFTKLNLFENLLIYWSTNIVFLLIVKWNKGEVLLLCIGKTLFVNFVGVSNFFQSSEKLWVSYCFRKWQLENWKGCYIQYSISMKDFYHYFHYYDYSIIPLFYYYWQCTFIGSVLTHWCANVPCMLMWWHPNMPCVLTDWLPNVSYMHVCLLANRVMPMRLTHD